MFADVICDVNVDRSTWRHADCTAAHTRSRLAWCNRTRSDGRAEYHVPALQRCVSVYLDGRLLTEWRWYRIFFYRTWYRSGGMQRHWRQTVVVVTCTARHRAERRWQRRWLHDGCVHTERCRRCRRQGVNMTSCYVTVTPKPQHKVCVTSRDCPWRRRDAMESTWCCIAVKGPFVVVSPYLDMYEAIAADLPRAGCCCCCCWWWCWRWFDVAQWRGWWRTSLMLRYSEIFVVRVGIFVCMRWSVKKSIRTSRTLWC